MAEKTRETFRNVHARLVELAASLRSMGIVASDGGMDASMFGRDEAIELLGVFLKYAYSRL